LRSGNTFRIGVETEVSSVQGFVADFRSSFKSLGALRNLSWETLFRESTGNKGKN
jgi:hypothetical protein